MGKITGSIITYAQPLLDETDGSHEQMQHALSMAQLCWNLALLSESERIKSLDQMRPALKLNDDEFADLYKTVFVPMMQRHRDMFPSLHKAASNKAVQRAPNKTYPGVGRNDPCPCKSEKKYKKCCGR